MITAKWWQIWSKGHFQGHLKPTFVFQIATPIFVPGFWKGGKFYVRGKIKNFMADFRGYFDSWVRFDPWIKVTSGVWHEIRSQGKKWHPPKTSWSSNILEHDFKVKSKVTIGRGQLIDILHSWWVNHPKRNVTKIFEFEFGRSFPLFQNPKLKLAFSIRKNKT